MAKWKGGETRDVLLEAGWRSVAGPQPSETEALDGSSLSNTLDVERVLVEAAKVWSERYHDREARTFTRGSISNNFESQASFFGAVLRHGLNKQVPSATALASQLQTDLTASRNIASLQGRRLAVRKAIEDFVKQDIIRAIGDDGTDIRAYLGALSQSGIPEVGKMVANVYALHDTLFIPLYKEAFGLCSYRANARDFAIVVTALVEGASMRLATDSSAKLWFATTVGEAAGAVFEASGRSRA